MIRSTVGAACWIGTAAFFVGQVVAQAAVTTEYSLVRNYVSDLGSVNCGELVLGPYRAEICSPLHVAMNAGFVVTGVAMVAGAVLLGPIWPPGRSRSWGLALVVLGGVGKVVAGLAPGDVLPLVHLGGGTLSGPAATVGILLLGWSARRPRRGLSRFTTACGLVGVLGLAATAAAAQGVGTGMVGAAERVAAYPTIVWTIAVGGYVLCTQRRPV